MPSTMCLDIAHIFEDRYWPTLRVLRILFLFVVVLGTTTFMSVVLLHIQSTNFAVIRRLGKITEMSESTRQLLNSSGSWSPASPAVSLNNTQSRENKTVNGTALYEFQQRSSVRLLCWIMTSPVTHRTKADHVKATWGRRCDRLLFFSEGNDTQLPTVWLNVNSGRFHLTAKTVQAFDYIHRNHKSEADWFMKADDDTYVVVDNLRRLLSRLDSHKPLYVGHIFNVHVQSGYASGGAGYVLSADALRRFAERTAEDCGSDGGSEDLQMGMCMHMLHVVAYHDDGFHWHGVSAELDGIKRQQLITVHYVSPSAMHHFERLVSDVAQQRLPQRQVDR